MIQKLVTSKTLKIVVVLLIVLNILVGFVTLNVSAGLAWVLVFMGFMSPEHPNWYTWENK